MSDGRKLELRQAVCEYDGRNQSFRFYSKDLTQTVPEKVFQAWQSSGIPASIALVPSSSTRRVRIVLLDAATGLTGAIDIPVLASDIASANAPAPSPEPPATPSFADLPDREPIACPPKSTAALSFHVKSGQAGSLDWNGDVLLYKGDLPPDLTAGALFTYVFGNRFRCDSGDSFHRRGRRRACAPFHVSQSARESCHGGPEWRATGVSGRSSCRSQRKINFRSCLEGESLSGALRVLFCNLHLKKAGG